jgi:hypothetical protein
MKIIVNEFTGVFSHTLSALQKELSNPQAANRDQATPVDGSET